MRIPLRASLRRLCLALVALTAVAAGGGAVGWRGDSTGCFPQANPPTTWDGGKGTHVVWRADNGFDSLPEGTKGRRQLRCITSSFSLW